MELERFHRAQDSSSSGYATALHEIQRGCKASHWIWYVFPQMAGLGRSATAQQYALANLDEACAYLRDRTLRERWEEIATAVSTQLTKGVPVEVLMGSSIDALKLASNLTLFRAAACRLGECDPQFTALYELGDTILRQMEAQGYPECRATLEKIS